MISALMLLYPVSCATQPSTSRFEPVFLSGQARYYLLPAAEIERPVDCAQQISVRYEGQEFTMDAWVKADANGIEMSLFNALGVGMGDFSFSDDGVSLNSPVFPPSFKAEYMAADFQLCYFRREALGRALGEIGLSLDVIGGGDENGLRSEIRRISEAGELIIEIEKNGNEIRYANFLRGYGYTLREAE